VKTPASTIQTRLCIPFSPSLALGAGCARSISAPQFKRSNRTAICAGLGLSILFSVICVASEGQTRKSAIGGHPFGGRSSQSQRRLHKDQIASLFKRECAGCHGTDGSGRQVRNVFPSLPDFTDLSWQISKTDSEITRQIHDGKPQRMPAFRDKLSHPEIVALAIYTRAFAVESTKIDSRAERTKNVMPSARVKMLFRARCAECHGENGRGTSVRQLSPEIPDFTDVKWQAARSDSQLRHSILEGKGAAMPSMRTELADREVDQMVVQIRSFGAIPRAKQTRSPLPKVTPSPPSPAQGQLGPSSAESAPNLSHGETIYRTYCATCHGATGTGDVIRQNMPAIPDFTNPAWHASHSDARVQVSVLDGRGTLMPSFRGRVSDSELKNLVGYLRRFGDRGADRPSDDFAKQFQELQSQFRELEKQRSRLGRNTIEARREEAAD